MIRGKLTYLALALELMWPVMSPSSHLCACSAFLVSAAETTLVVEMTAAREKAGFLHPRGVGALWGLV